MSLRAIFWEDQAVVTQGSLKFSLFQICHLFLWYNWHPWFFSSEIEYFGLTGVLKCCPCCTQIAISNENAFFEYVFGLNIVLSHLFLYTIQNIDTNKALSWKTEVFDKRGVAYLSSKYGIMLIWSNFPRRISTLI